MHPEQFGKTSFSDICCLCGIVLCTLSIVGYVIKDRNGIDHVEKIISKLVRYASCIVNCQSIVRSHIHFSLYIYFQLYE